MARYIAAFDQGTTSSRVILFDRNGKSVARAQYEFPQVYPMPGRVEQDGEDIFRSQMRAFSAALHAAGATADEIAAIGVANQRETVLVWERDTGKPIFHAIVWQCRRTSDVCERIKAEYGALIRGKTGLNVDAYFLATKIGWGLDHVPGARARAERGELAFGTVDCFLIWRLTGGKVHATDYTNASRTMLFNIHTKQWDEELCHLFGVPTGILPRVMPSGAFYGMTDRSVAGAEIPVRAAVGDQQASLFGHLCLEDGQVKNTYGTGCFLLMNTGDAAVRSEHGLLTTLSASLDDRPSYVLEGSVFVAGAALQWLRDGLGILSSAAESEALAQSVADNGGVYFVPAFVGLGAPYWDAECRGMFYGITRGTTRAHIVRSALEAIALQVCDVVHAMECDRGASISCLCADGGASSNGFLMQFQADVAGKEIALPAETETTALGAAYLAGLSCGFYRDIAQLRGFAEAGKRYLPQIDASRRDAILRNWQDAIARARVRFER